MKVGVYVDTENITRNGGRGLRYDVLREFACREQDSQELRLNAYSSFDEQRAQTDLNYRRNANSFHEALRDFGYKVIVKPVKWYINEDGKRFGKANSDLDMAVDALLEARNVDRVILATGDGDFTRVVRSLQNMGTRVEIVAFDNVSGDLRREADMFFSGYLVPGLLPSEGGEWGSQEGSRVRGLCHWYDPIKGFGFIRFLKSSVGPLWVTDTNDPDSPYDSTFVHNGEIRRAGLDPRKLPSRSYVLEFTLKPSPVKENTLTAQDIVVYPKQRPYLQRQESQESQESTPETGTTESPEGDSTESTEQA